MSKLATTFKHNNNNIDRSYFKLIYIMNY